VPPARCEKLHTPFNEIIAKGRSDIRCHFLPSNRIIRQIFANFCNRKPPWSSACEMSRYVNFRLSRAVLSDLPLREQHGSRLRPLSQQGKPLTYSSCSRARARAMARVILQSCVSDYEGAYAASSARTELTSITGANARIAHLSACSFFLFSSLFFSRLQTLHFWLSNYDAFPRFVQEAHLY